MTRILTSLSQVAAQYDAVYCDLWGCLHNGKAPFPAAVAALQAFRAKGGLVVLLTNAPRPKPAVIRQLDRLGVPHDCYDEVVTSGDAAQYALVSGAVGTRVWHLGPEKDETFFTEMADDMPKGAMIDRVPLAEAQGIVCTGLFDDLTESPEDYRGRLMLAREAGLTIVSTFAESVLSEHTLITLPGGGAVDALLQRVCPLDYAYGFGALAERPPDA